MRFIDRLLLGTALGLPLVTPICATAQTALPSVTIQEEKKAKPAPVKTAIRPARAAKVAAARPAARSAPRKMPAAPAPSSLAGTTPIDAASAAQNAAVVAARAGETQAQAVRSNILPKVGANSTTITQQNIQNLPAGNNTSFDRVLLQLPGVTEDSAASGDFHIRNEHANVQYRINGIFLPDGVSGFSQILSAPLIRSLSLIDGALPAQYGLRTAGIIDIETQNGADRPGGDVGVFGGSRGTIVSTIDYAGVYGRWDYFVTGRYNTDRLGIENPLPTQDAIHDRTRQGRYFAYASGLLEDDSRLTFMSGATISKYQIPNTPGTAPSFTAFGIGDFNSALLNENQVERSIFNVIAWQKSFGALDSQISYFQRYSTLHFVPDPIGDLVFNGVASDVSRISLVNGIQGDNAYRSSERNTIRFGFTASVERASAIDTNVVLPTNADGDPFDMPFSIGNNQRRTGTVAGVYVQDEYRLTRNLTVNAGLRYDYMQQYVTADQLSPRLGAEYRPGPDTVFHAGYARYFTPPNLALSAPSPAGIFANTTLAPEVEGSDPVRPERAHYFDVGVTRRVLPGLDLGIDAYYKLARNLLDDGQFGQALVLTAFNYDRAYNRGVEFKANYQNGNFRAYGNLAYATQQGKQISSNQYLFEADELAFIQNNYVFTDHAQFITVSGGGSYRIYDTTLSTDIIYGSGLRNGFANTDTVSPYATVNVGAAHEFRLLPGLKPTTLRFTIVNLFDNSYLIRDGSGIGVFQAQYGQRRGFFAGLSQRF